LRPISSALDGDLKNYITHWRQLILYETFCKLTLKSTVAPSYLPCLLKDKEEKDHTEEESNNKASGTYQVPRVRAHFNTDNWVLSVRGENQGESSQETGLSQDTLRVLASLRGNELVLLSLQDLNLNTRAEVLPQLKTFIQQNYLK
jgi:hypothetical protein